MDYSKAVTGHQAPRWYVPDSTRRSGAPAPADAGGLAALTARERSIIGRIGAYALHAQGRTNTGPARIAFWGKFEREVDPDGILPEGERQRRATAARKEHYARMGLKSAQKKKRMKKTDLKVKPASK